MLQRRNALLQRRSNELREGTRSYSEGTRSYSEGTICSGKRSDPPLSPAASTEDTKEAAGFKKRDERAYCSGAMKEHIDPKR